MEWFEVAQKIGKQIQQAPPPQHTAPQGPFGIPWSTINMILMIIAGVLGVGGAGGGSFMWWRNRKGGGEDE